MRPLGPAPWRAGRATALAVLAAALPGCRDPTAGPGWLSGTRPPPPTYRAVHVSEPIAVDGRLDEPGWSRAQPAELVETLTGRPPRYRTEARLLWDERALYVGFACEDDEVWARPGRVDDDPIYEDEVVEIFLDPSGVGRGYGEIEVSPDGVRFGLGAVKNVGEKALGEIADLLRREGLNFGMRYEEVEGAVKVLDPGMLPMARVTDGGEE